MMVVDVNEVERCLRYFKTINATPLEDIVWVRGNETLRPTSDQLQEFAAVGLSNRDFPAVVGWLPDGVGVKITSMIITKDHNGEI